MLVYAVLQNTTFVLLLSYRSVSGGFYLVYCRPCLLMCRCLIVVLLDFSICLLISFSVRPGHLFREPFFIAMRRLVFFGMKSDAYKYCDCSGLYVWSIMLFLTDFYCCVSRVTSHITVFLFMVPLIISCPLFWTDISCLFSVMVNPSSHKTPNDISGDIFNFWGNVDLPGLLS